MTKPNLHWEITGEEMPVLSLSQHVEAWLKREEPEVAASTYSFYKGVAKILLIF